MTTSNEPRSFKTVRHYAGGVYWVLGDAVHTETDELLTIYVDAVSGVMFCRPKAMFDDVVTTEDGYTGPRFVPFPDGTAKAGRKLLPPLK
jgi:hypothetical protein